MSSPTLVPVKKTLWKRIADWCGKTVVFAVVSALTLAALAVAYDWYRQRPTPVKKWDDKQLSEGMALKLKTVSRGGTVQYQFTAKPSPGFETAFKEVAPEIPHDRLFTIILNDRDGFEICKETLDVINSMGDKGIEGFMANGSFLCGDDYSRAEKWSVGYNSSLKKIVEHKASVTPAQSKDTTRREDIVGKMLVDVPESVIRKPARLSEIGEQKFEGLLAGFDMYSGELETREGQRARVSQPGRRTAAGWPNSSRLKFSCKGESCVVEQVANGEAVRAQLLR